MKIWEPRREIVCVILTRTDAGGIEWHGTNVLSKIAGHNVGVSRNVNVIIVRLANSIGHRFIFHGLDALLQTYDDIKARHSKDKVVINFSNVFWPEFNKQVKPAIEDIMTEIIKLQNTLFVMGAGSRREKVRYSTTHIELLNEFELCPSLTELGRSTGHR